jgi:hypothetical protein
MFLSQQKNHKRLLVVVVDHFILVSLFNFLSFVPSIHWLNLLFLLCSFFLLLMSFHCYISCISFYHESFFLSLFWLLIGGWNQQQQISQRYPEQTLNLKHLIDHCTSALRRTFYRSDSQHGVCAEHKGYTKCQILLLFFDLGVSKYHKV